MLKKYFHNAKIICVDRVIESGYVYIEGRKILDFGQGEIYVAENTRKIDLKGCYLSPGFIDLHIHGGGGYDFMDATVEAFLGVANTHVKYGTTSMCPTSLTADIDSIYRVLDCYQDAYKKNTDGAEFLGIHLEGPYLAMGQRGAQDPKYIRNPDPEEYKKFLSHSPHIIRWSAAPELPGALDFSDYLVSQGKLVSLAHTDAIYEEVVRGFEHGFSLATHFYSAMSGITRKNAKRYAGVIESGYLIEDMDVEIIADGIHVPAPLLQLIYKIKGPDRIALVTDAMRAAAMPEGQSVLGRKEDGLPVIVEDGVAKLLDRSAFAGSVATADRLLRNYIELVGIPLVDAVKMLTATPARILKINNQKGAIAKEMDADLVVLNSDLCVEMTVVGGEIKYKRQ
ncbi:N-acetylglucosamine-6-phosphate deacetylase [Sphingobacterium endophyticum]|uniref:N-acetylglucosamine-6-phosphate deacetylase n=1 Tax=Sphingobacterium endophyticum TaxID=2546448 RepID=UPI0012E2F0AA|nr:N-acetylglucosamine-6-phosphate deacetylase [Sphingobacterium endophyticum]